MCPDCGEPMVIYELGGVEADRCLRCGGTWLDGGELERMASEITSIVDDAVDWAEKSPYPDPEDCLTGVYYEEPDAK